MRTGSAPTVVLLTAVLLLTGACTHTYHVRPGDRSNPDVVRLHERGRERPGTIHRLEGDPIPFQSAEFQPDAVIWVGPDGGLLREVQAVEVSYVEFIDQRRGGVEGISLGMGAGFVAGLMWGLASYDGGETDPLHIRLCLDNCSKTEHTFANGVAGAIIGGIGGLTLGVIRGTRLRYHLLVGLP